MKRETLKATSLLFEFLLSLKSYYFEGLLGRYINEGISTPLRSKKGTDTFVSIRSF
ncbi:MAG: hypothetical protein ACRENZ_09610 [Thermodesulfobacteriota bacterium]